MKNGPGVDSLGVIDHYIFLCMTVATACETMSDILPDKTESHETYLMVRKD